MTTPSTTPESVDKCGLCGRNVILSEFFEGDFYYTNDDGSEHVCKQATTPVAEMPDADKLATFSGEYVARQWAEITSLRTRLEQAERTVTRFTALLGDCHDAIDIAIHCEDGLDGLTGEGLMESINAELAASLQSPDQGEGKDG